MVKRLVKTQNEEPNEVKFELPSQKEHLFQVVDVLENIDPDPNIVHAKLEVVGGTEEGRSILHRCNLDQDGKGFFATRFLLKALSLPYKGEFEIDTDDWIGRQAYANVVHNGKYANIREFNFEKIVQTQFRDDAVLDPKDIQWEE